MSQFIVDLLEFIEVDEHRREWRGLPLRLRKGAPAALMEFAAVGQLRQAVLARQSRLALQYTPHFAQQPGATKKDRQPHAGIEQQREWIGLLSFQYAVSNKPHHGGTARDHSRRACRETRR